MLGAVIWNYSELAFDQVHTTSTISTSTDIRCVTSAALLAPYHGELIHALIFVIIVLLIFFLLALLTGHVVDFSTGSRDYAEEM